MAHCRRYCRLPLLIAATACVQLAFSGPGIAADSPPSRYPCKTVSQLLPAATAPQIAVTVNSDPATTSPASITSPDAGDLPPVPPRFEALPADTGRVTLAVLSPTESEASDAVPLPPRMLVEPELASSKGVVAPPTTSTVFDLVVSAAASPQPPVTPPEGWRASESVPLPPRAESITVVTAPPAPTVAAISVTLQPVVEAGVFDSDALFSGVPPVQRELAPRAIGEDELDSTRGLAFATDGLAPQPLMSPDGIRTAWQDYLGEGGVGSGDGLTPPAGKTDGESYSPERMRQLQDAADDLLKPVRSISMTQHLAGREPPDLAKVVEPPGQTELLWGAPWPHDQLRWYRYTVPFEHRPLYFEQPNLERCGTHQGIFTPYLSAAHFFGNVVLLPVHLVLEPPCVLVPTLGDCPTCSEGYGLCPTLGR